MAGEAGLRAEPAAAGAEDTRQERKCFSGLKRREKETMASAVQPQDEIASVREHLSRYRSVTLQTLEYVPDNMLGWRPFADFRSFGDQFVHIARVNEFYIRGLVGGSWDFQGIINRTSKADSRVFILAELTASRDLVEQKLATVQSPALKEYVSVPQIPMPWTLRDWLWYMVEHEVHHKAQVALYLRHLGITPPFFALAFPNKHRPDIQPPQP